MSDIATRLAQAEQAIRELLPYATSRGEDIHETAPDSPEYARVEQVVTRAEAFLHGKPYVPAGKTCSDVGSECQWEYLPEGQGSRCKSCGYKLPF